jgi:predicted metal-dependent peptidase
MNFSTEIENTLTFTRKDKITQFNFEGRGGTDYTDVMKDIYKNKPKFALIFTDLYCDFPPKPDCNTHIIWVSTTPEENVYRMPPYGKVIYYQRKEE